MAGLLSRLPFEGGQEGYTVSILGERRTGHFAGGCHQVTEIKGLVALRAFCNSIGLPRNGGHANSTLGEGSFHTSEGPRWSEAFGVMLCFVVRTVV